MEALSTYLKINIWLSALVAVNSVAAHADIHKNHHVKRSVHHAAVSHTIFQKTVINNYGLINNGVVQKTQQSSMAISSSQDNSSHQDNSAHQTLNQTQNNTLNQTQVNTQINTLQQTQVNNGVSSSTLPQSGPQQSFSPLSWSTTDGVQYLEIKDKELTLKPRAEGTGPHTVTVASKFSLPDTKIWQLSFDIRFGVLKDQASSFHVKRNGRDIAWIGADGFSTQMGLFIGSDSEIFALAADTEWHHVSYLSNVNNLTVGLDGKQIGTGDSSGIPDSVALLNNQDMSQPCHQGGVSIRNVRLQTESE